MLRTLVPSLLAAGLLAGCTEEATPAPRLELTRLQSCVDVADRLRAQAIADMEARLAKARREALAQKCQPFVGDIEDAGGDDADVPAPSSEDGPSQTSGTNNQVAGVDEADFVKAGDGYLYIANAGKLRIIDAWPPEEAHVVSETKIEGSVKKMFVHEGHAVVYSSLDGGGSSGARECTYGYSCSFTGDGHPTKMTVLDLADLAHPRVVREIRLSGSLLAARRIGTGIHTVVGEHPPGLNLPVRPEGITSCTPNIAKMWAFEMLHRRNLEELKHGVFGTFVPSAEDNKDGELGGHCDRFFGADLGDGAELTSVLSLDLTEQHGAGFSSIVSRPGAIYGSADALYMAVPRAFDDPDAEDEESAIHKFAITTDPLGTEYRGSGRVPGHVLNQFAMDEHEGALRVATTIGQVPMPNTRSSLTVLREANGALETVGAVDDIAPTEDIRSVRFAGSRAFVVTFKKTDPLYVFDLARQEDPRILSELKIPGFSTYMHMLDDGHLLSVGYDAEDHGSFAFFSGMLLQIFDVTNPLDPKLAHRHVIGTRGSSSEALTNHLAFTYFAPKQALALPTTICEGGNPPSFGQLTFSGLLVFRATAESGFTELGRVPHQPGPNVSCSNWWTDAESQVRRSVFMDDYVFSISNTTVKANPLSDLAHHVASIPIAN